MSSATQSVLSASTPLITALDVPLRQEFLSTSTTQFAMPHVQVTPTPMTPATPVTTATIALPFVKLAQTDPLIARHVFHPIILMPLLTVHA